MILKTIGWCFVAAEVVVVLVFMKVYYNNMDKFPRNK